MPVLGPYVIDTVDYGKWPTTVSPTPGPFQYGTKLFMVFPGPNTEQVPWIWKSVDGGSNWTIIRGSHAAYFTYARQGSSASKIALASLEHAGVGPYPWTLEEFDMDSETFTLVDTSSFTNQLNFMDYSPVTNEWRLYYRPTNGFGNLDLAVKRYASGYVGDITITSPPQFWNGRVGTSVNDPAGGTIIIYWEEGGGSPQPRKFYYVRMDPTGSLGTPIKVWDEAAYNARPLPTLPVLVGNTVIVPYRQYDAAALPYILYRAAAWVFDDYTLASPSWTSVVASVNYISEVAAASDGSLWWIAINDPLLNTLDQLEMASFDGAIVGSIQIIHDEIATPSFPVLGQFQHDLAPPVVLSDGSYGWHLALEYFPPGVPFQRCTGFYWNSGPSSPGGGGGISGDNDAMLVLDLSSAIQTLPDYD